MATVLRRLLWRWQGYRQAAFHTLAPYGDIVVICPRCRVTLLALETAVATPDKNPEASELPGTPACPSPQSSPASPGPVVSVVWTGPQLVALSPYSDQTDSPDCCSPESPSTHPAPRR